MRTEISTLSRKIYSQKYHHCDGKNRVNVMLKLKTAKLIVFICCFSMLLTVPSAFYAQADYSSRTMVKVDQYDTELITAPTVVQYAADKESLENVTESNPSMCVFTVDSELNCKDSSGNTICSLADGIEKLGDKIIPAFDVSDTDTAKKIIAYIETLEKDDVTFISSDIETVKYIREYSNSQNRIYRAVIDFSDVQYSKLTEKQLVKIRDSANTALTKIVILPSYLATADAVEFLQQRLMTVWVKCEQNETDILTAINSGANGIVCLGAKEVFEVFSKFYTKNSFSRTPFIIAHRGASAICMQNTLEGAKLAYEKGADVIELDIHLTKDNHLIVIHDSTMGGLVIEQGKYTTVDVTTLTLEQVQSVIINRGYEDEYPEMRVPTLRSFFEFFKDKEVILLIEYKNQTTKIGEALAELIAEFDIADQVNTLTYSTYNYPLPKKALAETFPGISVSRLSSAVLNSATGNNTENIYKASELYTALRSAMTYNTTMSPQSSNLTKAYYEVMSHRGMTVWPWVITSAQFDSFFMMGTAGMTTDYCHLATDMVKKLSTEKVDYLLKDTVLKPTVSAVKYSTEATDVTSEAELIVIENDNVVTVNGDGSFTGFNNGKFSYMFKYKTTTPKGSEYTLYTQPVTVEVVEKIPEVSEESEDDSWITDVSEETSETPESAETSETSDETTEEEQSEPSSENGDRNEEKETSAFPTAPVVICATIAVSLVALIVLINKKS